MHKLTRVIYKFIPTFGKLTDLTSYQAKSSDKLAIEITVVNLCVVWLVSYTHVINPYFFFKFLIFVILVYLELACHDK